MKIIRQILGCFLILPVSASYLFAQTLSDSTFVAEAEQYISEIYAEQLNSGARIYNGKMYRPFLNLDNGDHTLFQSNEYSRGSITYEGRIYKDLNLMYDLFRDQLVLLNYDKVGGIVIWPQYVDSFSIHQHKFIHIKPDSSPHTGFPPGYYDLIYDGRTRLLAKRTKTISETADEYKVKKNISEKSKYYILKDSAYTQVKSKKDLLKLLHRTQNENQNYIKKEHLNFKKNFEDSMVRLLSHHDSIPPNL